MTVEIIASQDFTQKRVITDCYQQVQDGTNDSNAHDRFHSDLTLKMTDLDLKTGIEIRVE